MSDLVRWFGPPDLARSDLRRTARALWIVSWPFLAVVTVVLGIAVLVEPETLLRRLTTISLVAVLITFLHAVSHSGRPRAASWILVIGLSVIVTQRARITGGIHAPVPVFYALFIVMGGVLLGQRGGLVTAAVCVGGAIVLTIGTSLELLEVPLGAGRPLGAFVFVVLAIGLAVVLQTLVNVRYHREERSPDAVSMIVHDMRSPMQVLLAHLELLREDVRGEGAKDLEAAIGGATTLHRMTTSLLDVGRLEAGKMPVRPQQTDITKLANGVLNSFRILQPSRELIVEGTADATCNCDPELTRRIIENLVSNALKHTPVDGHVRVVITQSPGKVCVAVHDQGRGVPVVLRQKLFEPYSAEGLRSATGYESSGLGLTFCKLAAEAQGGSIRIEDGKPGGSVFIVQLPA